MRWKFSMTNLNDARMALKLQNKQKHHVKRHANEDSGTFLKLSCLCELLVGNDSMAARTLLFCCWRLTRLHMSTTQSNIHEFGLY